MGREVGNRYSKMPDGENSKIKWPVFKDGDKVLPTEFKEGSWKCSFCNLWIVRIKQHLLTHRDKVQRWEDAEKFSSEVSERKRKIHEQKRAQDPMRKEYKAKVDEKRAKDPKRKETMIKAGKRADEKRAKDPKRKERLKFIIRSRIVP